ncbi:hypothetical protein N0V84_008734 [Fusarium piperis]|uniref:Uncharacterized protein n=1 Tax=Fusarium piperis TaxID=1435070 RepID=A0A9W8W7K2_9HYPO|nr:hypothetical protein N0V84_008734 [Fusarium piperis]
MPLFLNVSTSQIVASTNQRERIQTNRTRSTPSTARDSSPHGAISERPKTRARRVGDPDTRQRDDGAEGTDGAARDPRDAPDADSVGIQEVVLPGWVEPLDRLLDIDASSDSPDPCAAV